MRPQAVCPAEHVTSGSVRQVHQTYSSQYAKFQGILEFVGLSWLNHHIIFSEPPSQWKTT